MMKTYTVSAEKWYNKKDEVKVSAYTRKQAKLRAFMTYIKGMDFNFERVNHMRRLWMNDDSIKIRGI